MKNQYSECGYYKLEDGKLYSLYRNPNTGHEWWNHEKLENIHTDINKAIRERMNRVVDIDTLY